jgi:hypothetical protein
VVQVSNTCGDHVTGSGDCHDKEEGIHLVTAARIVYGKGLDDSEFMLRYEEINAKFLGNLSMKRTKWQESTNDLQCQQSEDRVRIEPGILGTEPCSSRSLVGELGNAESSCASSLSHLSRSPSNEKTALEQSSRKEQFLSHRAA